MVFHAQASVFNGVALHSNVVGLFFSLEPVLLAGRTGSLGVHHFPFFVSPSPTPPVFGAGVMVVVGGMPFNLAVIFFFSWWGLLVEVVGRGWVSSLGGGSCGGRRKLAKLGLYVYLCVCWFVQAEGVSAAR